jgi:hypothetical protein
MKNLCACGCGQLVNKTYALGHHWKVQAKNAATENPNPSGLCQCGCGTKTNIARTTVHARGVVKGFPHRFAPGHGYVKHREAKGPNPSGLCMCGCGAKTSLAKYTDPKRGCVKGQPKRFIHNHHQESYEPETSYKVEDRGFETPCWVWQRWTNDRGGYGFFTRKKKPILAHRYFYATYVRPIPPGAEVHHRCHVTACVNPDHLEAVTNLFNERNKKVMKLSMKKARTIRKLFEWGSHPSDIAHVFRLKKTLILAVLNNKIWKEGAE